MDSGDDEEVIENSVPGVGALLTTCIEFTSSAMGRS